MATAGAYREVAQGSARLLLDGLHVDAQEPDERREPPLQHDATLVLRVRTQVAERACGDDSFMSIYYLC